VKARIATLMVEAPRFFDHVRSAFVAEPWKLAGNAKLVCRRASGFPPNRSVR
jgi:hypothetical protein